MYEVIRQDVSKIYTLAYRGHVLGVFNAVEDATMGGAIHQYCKHNKVVEEFRDLFHFLSNFWISPSGFCVENHYQAAKFSPENPIRQKIFDATPGNAKRLGRTREGLRNDWDYVRADVMYILLKKKFEEEPLRSWLVLTGEAELQEGNSWNDTFWGVSKQTGQGANTLGRLLMRVREEIVYGWVLDEIKEHDLIKKNGLVYYIEDVVADPIRIKTLHAAEDTTHRVEWMRGAVLVGAVLPETGAEIYVEGTKINIPEDVHELDKPIAASFLRRWLERWSGLVK